MKRLIVFFILIIISLNIRLIAKEENEKIESETQKIIDEIYKDYGVKIIFDVKTMIPQAWLFSPINAKVTKLDNIYYNDAIITIHSTLKKYSKKFINIQLNSICLCSSLFFYDVEYGGTSVYENHSIILAIKNYTKPEWIDSTINHEFNHLLIYWNDFPKEKWIKCNTENFQYGDGGVIALQSGHSNTNRTESSFEEGFVCEYAKSDFIEDVATMFEYIMSDRKDFYERALKYKIIKNKFKILKTFYYGLDKSFNEKYWSENFDGKIDDLTDNYNGIKKSKDNSDFMNNELLNDDEQSDLENSNY